MSKSQKNNKISDKKQIREKALSEIAELVKGKTDLDVKDLAKAREYSATKTTLNKNKKDLSLEELIWRELYHEFDEAIVASMSTKSAKNEFDSHFKQINELEKFKNEMEIIVEVAHKVEKLFDEQMGYIHFHFKDDSYRGRLDRAQDALLGGNLPPADIVDGSKTVLEFIEQYRKISLEKMDGLSQEIETKLRYIEKNFKALRAVGDELLGANEFNDHFGNWISLSKNLHLSRTKVVNGIKLQVECDAFLPERLIKLKGKHDTPLTKEESEKFTESMMTYSVAIKESESEEKEIQSELNKVRPFIFAEEVEGAKINNHIMKSELEGKMWYRIMKVIYIVAWLMVAGLCLLLILADADFLFSLVVLGVASLVIFFLRKAVIYVVTGK